MSQTVNNQTSSAKRQTPISFIIPVYKTPLQLLRNCLDSVLKYSQPMELICVLDSPGDPCEQVLDEYAAKEPRMRLLKNDQNRGVSYSRNRGLDAAKGGYIAFVDADDIIYADGYEEGVKLAEDEGLDGCSLAGSKNRTARFGVDYGKHVIGSMHSPCALILARAFFWVVYPMVVRRAFLKERKITFLVGHRFGEDFMWVVAVLCAGRRLAFLNRHSYLGVGHSGSTCQSTPTPEKYLHMLMAVSAVVSEVIKFGVATEVFRWYVSIVVPLVLFDSKAAKYVRGEDRIAYLAVLKGFLTRLQIECGPMFRPAFRMLLCFASRWPSAWFFPGMPLSFLMRFFCHFNRMLKPLQK